MPENQAKVNFDLQEDEKADGQISKREVKSSTLNDEASGGSRTALQSRDTGLGESVLPSTSQSRRLSSLLVDGEQPDLKRRGSSQGMSAYSGSSRAESLMLKRQNNAYLKFADGMKKLKFFVRAYQAIKSSNEKKKSTIDLGELAALLKGAQVDQPIEEDEDEQDEMKVFKTFDPRQYKHNPEYTWPYMAFESIWRKPHERGIRDIRIIRGLMRGLHTYRKLPKKVQEGVARVVRLERCTRGRTVIRKGQVPENFFFIYAGKVNVSCFEDEESVYEAAQVVSQLHKGDWFGGVSMSRETGRELTVVAMEDCEFLVVDILDFPDTGLKEIILEALDKHFKLLRSHPFLKSCDESTIEKLVVETKVLYTPHDTVIVKDSTKCNHIYLVAKGSCDVMRWMSSSLLKNPIEFDAMKKTVKKLSIEEPSTAPRVSKTAQSTRRKINFSVDSGHNLMTASESMLKRELAQIKESKGKLPIEYLTFPMVDISREEQFQYWQKSRLDKMRNVESKNLVYQEDKGMFVKLESIPAGSSFGLPEQLQTITPMQLISNGSAVIEIPLSTFNRYLTHDVAPLIQRAFMPFTDLCKMSTEKFNRLNTWQSIKKSFTEDVRAQRIIHDMENFDIYYLQGGIAPTVHTPHVPYTREGRKQVHFNRPRHSLTNLHRLKLPSMDLQGMRPKTTQTIRTLSSTTRRPISRVASSGTELNSRPPTRPR